MRSHTRVKICGITRTEDALLCEQFGADALGFVFVPASKRFITPEDAKLISDQVAPFMTRVGLFLDAPAKDVEHAMKTMPGMLPQFHGQETAEECEQYGVPYLKAIGLGAGMPSPETLAAYKNAQAFLFDSNEPGQLGGTGHAFDWQKLGKCGVKPTILAGGLNPDNIQEAIKQVKPYAVDVSSGVEASKGIKDAEALKLFMTRVYQKDN